MKTVKKYAGGWGFSWVNGTGKTLRPRWETRSTARAAAQIVSKIADEIPENATTMALYCILTMHIDIETAAKIRNRH